MDWVYPAHVSCPIGTPIFADNDYAADCEAGYIAWVNAETPLPVRNIVVRHKQRDPGTILAYITQPPVFGGAPFPWSGNDPLPIEAKYFAGVVLDKVSADGLEHPMVTTQLRGVTNVRLTDTSIKYLTGVVKRGGDPYGHKLFMVAHNTNSGWVCKAAVLPPNRQLNANENNYFRENAIGFVHTYHCNSGFAEIEIMARYGDATAAGAPHLSRSSHFMAASAMVDVGDDASKTFVHHRPEDQATLNAASAFVSALEDAEKKSDMVVPLGSFVATAESHEHMPSRDLGVVKKTGEDGKVEVSIRGGTAAQFLLDGKMASKARKRKSMSAQSALEKDPDTLLIIQNGMLPSDPVDEPVDIYPSKHFDQKRVKRFKELLRTDIESGAVTEVSKYKAALSGVN